MTSLHTDRRETGAARLLFTHGWLGDPADWDVLRDRLGRTGTATCAAPGLAATSANGSWTFDGARSELDQEIDAHAPTVPVGSSISGCVALATAAKRKLPGVIAIAAAPRWITSDTYPFGFPREMANSVLQGLRISFAATVREVMPGAYLDEADPATAATIRSAIVVRAESAAQPSRLVDSLEQSFSVDIVEDLGSIGCPVLLICGERDHVVTPDVALWTAARIPDCTVEIIQGAGHLPHVTAPDAVSAAIRRFLLQTGVTA